MKSLRIFALGCAFGALFAVIIVQLIRSSQPAVKVSAEKPAQPAVTEVAERCAPDCKMIDPPEFAGSLTNPIATNREGELLVRWNPRDGASGYRVYLVDRKGREMRSWEAKKTLIYIKEFPVPEDPAGMTYQVRLASLNRYGVEGEKGPPRDVSVKPQVKLVAPKVKEIRIED